MPKIEVKTEIAQPPEIVSGALLDPANAVYWTTDLERFEVIYEAPEKVGSVARLHFTQGGRHYIMEDVLLEMIPEGYFRSRVTGSELEAIVETFLRDLEDGTELTMRWSGRGRSIRMRLMLFLMKGAMIRQMRKELEQFKSLVEARGKHFSDA